MTERWWKYAVLRGEGLPVGLDGRWYDLDNMPAGASWQVFGHSAIIEATNQWEQREDGAVAVVYRWFPST